VGSVLNMLFSILMFFFVLGLQDLHGLFTVIWCDYCGCQHRFIAMLFYTVLAALYSCSVAQCCVALLHVY